MLPSSFFALAGKWQSWDAHEIRSFATTIDLRHVFGRGPESIRKS